MKNILIKNAALKDSNSLNEILISDGKIKEIAKKINFNKTDNIETIDAQGNLVAPPLVDPHVHLDAVLVSGKLKRQNNSGTLLEAIDIWGEWKSALTDDILMNNAREVIKWYAANGVLRVRTHADCTDPTLRTVKCLLALKEEVKELIDIQVVAFPQDAVFTNKINRNLLEEAVKMGVDVIGGAPHIEYTREDGVKEVELIYDLAEKYDRLIDIHIDETGDPHSRFVEVMAKESINREFFDRATASHTTAMHNYNNDYAFKLIGNLAKAKINMITNPFDNTVLQNRTDGYPRKRGCTRVDELLEKGVNVSIGHDSIMDPWYSMGKGNMLAAAYLLMHTAQLNGYEQVNTLFDMITTNSAKTMHLSDYGIKPGNSADLIILDAENPFEAIRLQAECLYVIRKGKVISQTVPAKRTVSFYDGKTYDIDFKL